MKKKTWLSILMVNVMLVLFIGYWRTKDEQSAAKHQLIAERLDALENGNTPDFTLPDIDGKERAFLNVEGELILLHFWATWCAPCVIEYPSLLRLIEDFDGKIQLVAVSSDEEKKDILRFVKRFGRGGQHTLHLWDPEQRVSEQYGTEKLPETYIFNSEFQLLRKVPNTEDWDAPRVRDFFRFLLEQTEA